MYTHEKGKEREKTINILTGGHWLSLLILIIILLRTSWLFTVRVHTRRLGLRKTPGQPKGTELIHRSKLIGPTTTVDFHFLHTFELERHINIKSGRESGHVRLMIDL